VTTTIALAGIIGTLLGAIGGPLVADAWKRRNDAVAYARERRIGPYSAFAAAVETQQLELDRRIVGRTRDARLFDSQTDILETNRAQIDLVGSLPVRCWAYRCRLALTALDRSLVEADESRIVHYRAKLHEARAMFATNARSEIGVAVDRDKTADFGDPLGNFPDSERGHLAWLEESARDDALAASQVPRTELLP